MSAIWAALDANQQMFLILALTLLGGLTIACWSWHRAINPPPAKTPDPREIVYDWSVEAWADFDASERAK